jgi:hypothetical protein
VNVGSLAYILKGSNWGWVGFSHITHPLFEENPSLDLRKKSPNYDIFIILEVSSILGTPFRL